MNHPNSRWRRELLVKLVRQGWNQSILQQPDSHARKVEQAVAYEELLSAPMQSYS